MLSLMLLAASVGVAAEPATSAHWPGFRGDGSSTSAAKDLPVTWSPDENVAWRTTISGYGQSSPVIWGDRAFVAAIDGEQKEKLIVVAVDLKTGTVAWRKEFASTLKGKNNPMMSRAAPTPVVDADGVYAMFESGDAVALTHTGTLRWKRSLSGDYGAFKNNHGIGSSPTQTAGAVVVLIDDLGASYLVALDKATGKNLWKTDRASCTSWTSPIVASVGGRSTVLVSSNGSVNAYDAGTGKEFASLDGLSGNTIPSPTASGNLMVIGAGENRTKLDLAASANSNCCLRLNLAGDKPVFETVWQGKKAISHHASPLIYEGHVYFVTKTGFVHCVDLKTGEERYAERLANPTWATPVGAGGCVYFFGKDGVTTVLKAGAKYEKLATNRLWAADSFAARQEQARKIAAETMPKRPEGKGPGGGPPLPKEELEAARNSAVGDVVYGVAVGERTFLIRTGTELICIRQSK